MPKRFHQSKSVFEVNLPIGAPGASSLSNLYAWSMVQYDNEYVYAYGSMKSFMLRDEGG